MTIQRVAPSLPLLAPFMQLDPVSGGFSSGTRDARRLIILDRRFAFNKIIIICRLDAKRAAAEVEIALWEGNLDLLFVEISVEDMEAGTLYIGRRGRSLLKTKFCSCRRFHRKSLDAQDIFSSIVISLPRPSEAI